MRILIIISTLILLGCNSSSQKEIELNLITKNSNGESMHLTGSYEKTIIRFFDRAYAEYLFGSVRNYDSGTLEFYPKSSLLVSACKSNRKDSLLGIEFGNDSLAYELLRGAKVIVSESSSKNPITSIIDGMSQSINAPSTSKISVVIEPTALHPYLTEISEIHHPRTMLCIDSELYFDTLKINMEDLNNITTQRDSRKINKWFVP